MCNSERVPTLLFLYTSDWSPNWVAAVGTLSAVIYVTYFVASRSLFVFEQFALIKFFLCTSSSLCPLPLSSILCPLTLSSSGHSAGLLRTFRCRLLPTLTLRTSRFLFLQSLIGFASLRIYCSVHRDVRDTAWFGIAIIDHVLARRTCLQVNIWKGSWLASQSSLS